MDLSGADVVLNENYREGQLSSLIAGLKSLPPETEAILLCLVDNPFITVDVVDEVVSAFRLTRPADCDPGFRGRARTSDLVCTGDVRPASCAPRRTRAPGTLCIRMRTRSSRSRFRSPASGAGSTRRRTISRILGLPRG